MARLCHNCGVPLPTLTPLADSESRPAVSSESLELAHLLTSNDPPLESELPSIREAIGDGQDRIIALDVQIGSLKAQIRDLRASLSQYQSRREEVAESVRRHQSVISPIRRVPAELICEIFLVASSSEDGVIKPPWYLGQICRSWRNHAVSYVALWVSLTVGPDVGLTLWRLKEQLLRSGNAAIDIIWQCGDDHPRLMDLLLPHSSRWRTLRFEDCGLQNFEWLNDFDVCLDRLQKVEVYSPDTEIYIPDVFSTARNLRKVILTRHDFSDSADIEIPWQQITHYHGKYSSARQLEILKAAARTLQECVIGFPEELDSEPADIFTLPNLCRLSSDYVNILAYLTAPSLAELRLVIGDDPMSLVAPFIHRSSCTLTRLALVECGITPEVISLLRTLPSLRSLLVDLEHDDDQVDTDSGSDWTTTMCMSGAPSDICPRLTSFELGYTHKAQVPWDSFFAMAWSRFQIDSSFHSRLSRLRVVQRYDAPSNRMVAKMKMLQNRGFDAAFADGDYLTKHLF
ncbi:hypothetical protein DFH06DRAFT_574259 [Mycena polygramma]|nr:hypothetical protein DFH06DRAFT_574259 [Mycena polygramma]